MSDRAGVSFSFFFNEAASLVISMCFYSNYSVWVCVHLQNWNFWVVGCSENIVTRWTSFPLVKLLVGMMRFWGKSLVKLSFIFPFSAKSKIIKVFFWFSIYLLISTYFNTLKLYVWVCEYEYNACREKKKRVLDLQHLELQAVMSSRCGCWGPNL